MPCMFTVRHIVHCAGRAGVRIRVLDDALDDLQRVEELIAEGEVAEAVGDDREGGVTEGEGVHPRVGAAHCHGGSGSGAVRCVAAVAVRRGEGGGCSGKEAREERHSGAATPSCRSRVPVRGYGCHRLACTKVAYVRVV